MTATRPRSVPPDEGSQAIDLSQLGATALDRLASNPAAYVGMSAGDSAFANELGWRRLRFRPQVLRDVGALSTTVALLGTRSSTPLLVAPTAMHRLAHDDGELATARAAAATGTTYVVSTMATTAIEDIAAAAPDGSRWMQVYIYKDRGLSRAMVERATAAGCRAIVLTVDSPGIPHTSPTGGRLNEDLPLPNLLPGAQNVDVVAMASDYAANLSFDDLAAIRAWTDLPLVVKGVMRGDDAVRCLEAGADAITVSNHGGRLVPGCMPTALALEEVVAAVGARCDVYVDGGVRSGADVLRALALGARAVMVGRPVWWGLALAGEQGVHAVLQAFRAELERVMALCGVNDVGNVPRDLVRAVDLPFASPS